MTASAPPARPPGPGSGLPILGALGRGERVAVLATLAISLGALVLELVLHVEGTPLFIVSAAGILGLAWVVGLATERLGALTGPQVGGILNATFGNIAELIIAFFALQAGLLTVVKASITGSIIGNLLLVLGVSLLAGGLRNGIQHFSQRVAGSNAALLLLALVGLFVPAVFAFSAGDSSEGTLTEESLLVAFALIAGYVLSIIWQFTNPERTLGGHGAPAGHGGPAWTGRTAVVVLLICAAFLAILSESLVGSIEPFIEQFGLSEFFVGVILIPTIGNLAEHIVAVQLAWKDKMEFAMAVCYGSSLQVALFVAPVLVLAGVLVGQPMNLVFHPLEVAAVAAAVGISALIALDGESNWLEGALLTIIYVILAITFFELR
jgi:Ca2+:H+ antiporter